MQKTEHYYTKQPTSKLIKKTIKVTIKGTTLNFITAPSVFSQKKIDLGTRILLENSTIRPNSSVLDLGCGYGAVGICIAKTIPSVHVTMTDINERATKLAQENATLNNVQADILTGDSYEPVHNLLFDYVLLNPPQTAGRALCFKLIQEALLHLNKNGTFYLVARHQKGGRMLEQKMKETFGNVETVARESGFRVYQSVKE